MLLYNLRVKTEECILLTVILSSMRILATKTIKSYTQQAELLNQTAISTKKVWDLKTIAFNKFQPYYVEHKTFR